MAVRLKKQKEEKQTFCGVCVALWNILFICLFFYHHFLSHKSHYTYYAVTFIIIFKGYYYTSQTDLNWVCTTRSNLNF